MLYTCKYKTHNQWFFRTIKNIKGDLVPKDMPPCRVFILEDESRMEVPLIGTIFVFDKDRFLHIQQNMSKEAGQQVKPM
jgi:hypothetical protein